MAVEIDKEVHIPESTGAVSFNDDYQEPVEFDPNAGSTGAVEFQSQGESVMPFDPNQVVMRAPAPGPIVMNQWPNAANTKAMKGAKKEAEAAQAEAQLPAEAKVVVPEGKKPAAKKTARAQTK